MEGHLQLTSELTRACVPLSQAWTLAHRGARWLLAREESGQPDTWQSAAVKGL